MCFILFLCYIFFFVGFASLYCHSNGSTIWSPNFDSLSGAVGHDGYTHNDQVKTVRIIPLNNSYIPGVRYYVENPTG